jgi:hypothetical protein
VWSGYHRTAHHLQPLNVVLTTIMPTVYSVLLDPAILLHVVQYLHLLDAAGVALIDVALSDSTHRPTWLHILRYSTVQ